MHVEARRENLYFERPSRVIYERFDIHPRTGAGDKVFYGFADEEETVREGLIAGIIHGRTVMRWHLQSPSLEGHPALLAFWETGEVIYEEMHSRTKRVTRPIRVWDYMRVTR